MTDVFMVKLTDCYFPNDSRTVKAARVAELAKVLDRHYLEFHHPIHVVERTDGGWTVLDGKTRVAAALTAGWETIPAQLWQG